MNAQQNWSETEQKIKVAEKVFATKRRKSDAIQAVTEILKADGAAEMPDGAQSDILKGVIGNPNLVILEW